MYSVCHFGSNHKSSILDAYLRRGTWHANAYEKFPPNLLLFHQKSLNIWVPYWSNNVKRGFHLIKIEIEMVAFRESLKNVYLQI